MEKHQYILTAISLVFNVMSKFKFCHYCIFVDIRREIAMVEEQKLDVAINPLKVCLQYMVKIVYLYIRLIKLFHSK